MAGQQYDPYANQYEENVFAYDQYDPNDPYSSEYLGNDQETYAGDEPEYGQVPAYDTPEPAYEAYDPGLIPEWSQETSSMAPPNELSPGNPDYYVSLEPCGRGSSCSIYNSSDSKCMIRLVGKGYRKDIEFSLDNKMDSVVCRILRCLEDEGICLDGIRVQGLPKKNCLKDCLAAICAPLTALCVQPRPLCCQTFRQPCCTPSSCPKRSSIISRRSTLSVRGSWDSRRPTVRSTRRRKPRKPTRCQRSSNCRPCRMARVCQGPNKEDCVLIKISPSLPKVRGVKCEKRSTGVGTDEFPELEIMLQGGKKKCASKHRSCVCPHCCSSGKMEIIKCRARKPKPCREKDRSERKPHRAKEKHKGSFDRKELEAMSEEELVKMLEELEKENPRTVREEQYDQEVLQTMTEEELIDELQRLERGSPEARLSFSQRPPRSPVNFALVESCHSRYGKGSFLESGSHLVVPEKMDEDVGSSKPKHFGRDTPLNVYSVHQAQNGSLISRSEIGAQHLLKKRWKRRSPETALLLKEVRRMVEKIMKTRFNESNGGPVSTAREEKPEEILKSCPSKDKVNAIFRRSNIWMSESDASHTGKLDRETSASPNKSPRLRHFLSSKSINVVARLRRGFSSRKSFRNRLKAKFEPSTDAHIDGPDKKFEKLRIYVETDKKEESAEFVPVELTEKKGSMHLNTMTT